MKKYIALILGTVPLLASAQLVMNSNFYVVLQGGTQANPTSLVITNPLPAGITNNGTGWIISENEFNQVQWNIGTNTGNYIVPFGYSTTDDLHVTCNITAAGTGLGVVKFATYHGANYNNFSYKPSDVTNVADYGKGDYSIDMVDRFWEVDAKNYTTKPMANIKFLYIRNGAGNEIATPNNITESKLIAQRFNTSLAKWDDFSAATGTDVAVGNIGAVSTGPVTPANFFRSWTLAVDSNLTGVNEVNGGLGDIVAWPNPATQNINVKFGSQYEGDATISITDVIGREIIGRNIHITAGMVLPVNVSALPAGMYFVSVRGSNFSAVSKFIKQ